MKKILTFLMQLKWYITFPLMSLLVWFFSFVSSSASRFWPFILNRVLVYFNAHSAEAGNSSLTILVNNIAWFIVGLNEWLPVYNFFNVFFLIIGWRLAFMAVRIFVKAITVGQV